LHEGSTLLGDLVYGWGNEGWSALDDYLKACIEAAMTSPGPILECGSGLSTLLLGVVAEQRGFRIYSLEHSADWASRLQKVLHDLRVGSVTLCLAPIRDYGEFSWYEAPRESLPASFEVVICDGPPRYTPGGRYGLLPVMRDRISRGALILLDDAGRPDERAIAKRWSAECGATCSILGESKPFALLRLP
jgi:predicted O-methyltransferase YrrM